MTLRPIVLLGCGVILLTGCTPGSSQTGSSDPGTGQAGSGPSRQATAGSLTWGDGDYGVVLAPGAAFDAASWTDQAMAIAAQGATVMAVEDISTAGIAAAVSEPKTDGAAKVALVGGSAGADAILQLSTEQPDLPDQLVLISPNTVVQGLGSEPKLFIASADEPGADVPQSCWTPHRDRTTVPCCCRAARTPRISSTPTRGDRC